MKTNSVHSKKIFSILIIVASFMVQCSHQEKLNDNIREPAATNSKSDLQRYAFERCTSNSRLYLEDQILKMPEEYYRSHENQWSKKIPMSCFQFAQRNHRGHYASCADENARPVANAARPCMTENYVTLTYNAYHDVMDCFNLDPKDFYLQIMIESGFHINAINKQGFDSGLTQFTANGIKKVTANNLVQRTQNVLLNSSRPSCGRISSIVKDFDISQFGVKNRCSMVALPNNPYRSMVFNYLHTMLDQIAIDELIEETEALKKVSNDKIRRHLIYLAYNRGIKGTNDLLDGYIASRKKVGHELTSEDFELDKNLSRVKKVLRMDKEKRRILKSAKIKKLSFAEYAVIQGATYVSDMKAAHDFVRLHLKDHCGGL